MDTTLLGHSSEDTASRGDTDQGFPAQGSRSSSASGIPPATPAGERGNAGAIKQTRNKALAATSQWGQFSPKLLLRKKKNPEHPR